MCFSTQPTKFSTPPNSRKHSRAPLKRGIYAGTPLLL